MPYDCQQHAFDKQTKLSQLRKTLEKSPRRLIIDPRMLKPGLYDLPDDYLVPALSARNEQEGRNSHEHRTENFTGMILVQSCFIPYHRGRHSKNR